MDPNQPPRRTIDELKMLYTVRPYLRDVIVEGRDDVAFLQWYFLERGGRHVKVFAVDDRVEVSEALVTDHGLSNHSCRSRVETLARVASSWNLKGTALTCVVDADFDVFEASEDVECLLRTDYAAMDVYSLLERPFTKFLTLAKKTEISAADVVCKLRDVWRVLFATRYLLHTRYSSYSIVDKFDHKCVPATGVVDFRRAGLQSLVRPSPNMEDWLLISLGVGDLFGRISDQGLEGIRGHDIAPLLIRFLGLKNEFARAAVVETTMRLAIEREDLDRQGLFVALVQRTA